MRFWIREVAGWLLVLLGLFVFYLVFLMLMSRQIFEAGSWTLVGIIVFRGGIHLLKVAVAARICLQAQQQIEADRGGRPRPRGAAPDPRSAARGPAAGLPIPPR